MKEVPSVTDAPKSREPIRVTPEPNGGKKTAASSGEVVTPASTRPPEVEVIKITADKRKTQETNVATPPAPEGDATSNWYNAAREPGIKYVSIGKGEDQKVKIRMTKGLHPTGAVVRDADPAPSPSKHWVPLSTTRETAEERQVDSNPHDIDGPISRFVQNSARPVEVEVRTETVIGEDLEMAAWREANKARVSGSYAIDSPKAQRAKKVEEILKNTQETGSGVLRTTLAVGANTEADARKAAADLENQMRPHKEYPFQVKAVAEVQPSSEAAHARAAATTDLQTPREVGTLTRLPIQRELSGVPNAHVPEFSVNGPEVPSGARPITIGRIVEGPDNIDKGPLQIPSSVIEGGQGIVVGATGKGKSTFLDELAKGMAEGGNATFIFDMKKDDHTQNFADRLQTSEVEGVNKQVVDGRMGTTDPKAPHYGIPFLEPIEGYPLTKHQDNVIAVAEASFTRKGAGGGGDSGIEERIHDTSLNRAVKGHPRDTENPGVYDAAGYNRLGQSRYGDIDPLPPTFPDFVKHVVNTVAQDPERASDHTKSLETFLERNTEHLEIGTPGQVLTAEQKIDVLRAVKEGRNIVVPFNTFPEETRPLVAGAYLNCIKESIELLNTNRQEGERAYRANVVIEEGGDAFPDTPAGNRLAREFTTARSLGREADEGGVSLVLAVQDLEKVPNVIKENATYTISFGVTGEENSKVIGQRLGLTEEQQKYLPDMKPGEVLVHTTANPNGAIRGELTHPNTYKDVKGTGDVVPPDDLIKRGLSDTIVTNEVRVAAEDAQKDPKHPQVEGWATTAVASHVMGLGPVKPEGALEEHLKGLPEAVRDEVVNDALSNAVRDVQKELLTRGVPPREVLSELAPVARALAGGEVPEENVNLRTITPEGRLNPIRRSLEDAIPPLDNGVSGDNAVAQLANLDEGTGQEVDNQYFPFVTALRQRIDTHGPDAPPINASEEYGDIPGRTANEQLANYNRLRNDIIQDPTLLTEDEWVATAEVRKALVGHIEASPRHPDSDTWAERGQPIPGRNAAEQLEYVASQENPARTRELVQQLLIPEKQLGESRFEGAVDSVIKESRRPYQTPDTTTGSVGNMVGQSREQEWAQGCHTLIAGNMRMHPTARRVLAEGVNGVIQVLLDNQDTNQVQGGIPDDEQGAELMEALYEDGRQA